MKTLFQCDFDGTITEKDVSFLLLDNFTDGSWHSIWKEYAEGLIAVGEFNQRAFAGVKEDRKTLLDYLFRDGSVKVRSGFRGLLEFCAQNNIDFVIVSNGLEFYIEAMLEKMNIKGVEVRAAKSVFKPSGMDVSYIGPYGKEVNDGFKDSYTEYFKGQGYRVVYAGNGMSDFSPARNCDHVFATGDLLDICRRENVPCVPFEDFNDIVIELRRLRLTSPL